MVLANVLGTALTVSWMRAVPIGTQFRCRSVQ
jgi:hypothetical protein